MSNPDYRPNEDLLWIAIDLDNTLAEGIWTPENPTPEIGPPIKANVNKCWQLVYAGFKIVIHTSRGWTDYERIEKWAIKNSIPFSLIVCGKLLARAYIDDRNLDINRFSWIPEDYDGHRIQRISIAALAERGNTETGSKAV